MKGLLLFLDDATNVAIDLLESFNRGTRLTDTDKAYIRSNFEQKCFITNDQYSIGYAQALLDASRAITNLYKD